MPPTTQQQSWQPAPPAPSGPAAVPAPKKKTGMIVAVVAVVVIIVVVVAFLALRGGSVTRSMTVSQFNTEMQANFANVNNGDTIIVTGQITDMIDNPIGPGSIVSLDGTVMTIFVDLPTTCAVGDSFTMTLTVTVITYQGQTGKWFVELGSVPDPINIAVPASAISCT